ncbi:MAG: hypothetical protein ABW007_01400, partial [Chitinophagaceae bacterium]
FFCAGDTLPFLAIFSSALIFFCYFFCIKAKKVNGDFDPSSKKKRFARRQKSKQKLQPSPSKKQRPLPRPAISTQNPRGSHLKKL